MRIGFPLHILSLFVVGEYFSSKKIFCLSWLEPTTYLPTYLISPAATDYAIDDFFFCLLIQGQKQST